MEKQGKKSKKRRNSSSGEKEKSFFPHDLKSIKENIKKEFLRSVKINNSFRVKGSRSNNVIINSMDDRESGYNTLEATNNDVIDSHCESNVSTNEDSDLSNNNKTESNSQINDSLVNKSCDMEVVSGDNKDVEQCEVDKNEPDELEPAENVIQGIDEGVRNLAIKCDFEKSESSECQTDDANVSHEHTEKDHATALPTIGLSLNVDRNRKYSLDNNILLRRPSWSQSEIDLHSVGKLPLERKSSFFRKKLDKFLKNTSEIFKKQSANSKPENIKRRGSISFSLQSLNNPAIYENDVLQQPESEDPGENFNNGKACSENSLAESQCSLPSQGTSRISLVSSQASFGDTHVSQPTLYASQPLTDGTLGSTNSLTEGYKEDPLLNSRAISFSSGLDNVEDNKRRKSKRANRVTWLASDSVAEYMRRIVEDRGEVDIPRSYSDTGTSPRWNSLSLSRSDSKGRRLSYQRAVSGEDPVRYQDRRKSKGSDQNEHGEVRRVLTIFTQTGLPKLEGFVLAEVRFRTLDYIHLICTVPNYLDRFYKGSPLKGQRVQYQSSIKELIKTEADYIYNMKTVVDVFMAVSHKLQSEGLLLELCTPQLFLNLPDVVNITINFWDVTFTPMLERAESEECLFTAEKLYMSYYYFDKLFSVYQEYILNQHTAFEYLKKIGENKDFAIYLNWCHEQSECGRLQLHDLLIKPMQKITKYPLLLKRIIGCSTNPTEIYTLNILLRMITKKLYNINRAIRQNEESIKLDGVINQIYHYMLDFKDDDMNNWFRQNSQTNLKAPIPGCIPTIARTVLYEGYFKYRDFYKEILDVRITILTDMMLVSRKTSHKSSIHEYRLVRTKYMLNRIQLLPMSKLNYKGSIYDRLSFIVLDDVGSAEQCFSIWDINQKDSISKKLLNFEVKMQEARVHYDLCTWFDVVPYHDVDDINAFFNLYFENSELNISREKINEKDIRERILAMLFDPDADFQTKPFNSYLLTEATEKDRRQKMAKLIQIHAPMKNSISRIQWSYLQFSLVLQGQYSPEFLLNQMCQLHQQLRINLTVATEKLKRRHMENIETLYIEYCKNCNRVSSAGDISSRSASVRQKLEILENIPMPYPIEIPKNLQTHVEASSSPTELAEGLSLEPKELLQPSLLLPTSSLMPSLLNLTKNSGLPQSPKPSQSPMLLSPNYPLSPKSPSSPRSPKLPSTSATSEADFEEDEDMDEDFEQNRTLRNVILTFHGASESESDTLVSKQSVSPRSPSLALSNSNNSNNSNRLNIMPTPQDQSPVNTMQFDPMMLYDLQKIETPKKEPEYYKDSARLYKNHDMVLAKFKNRKNSQSPRLLSPDTRSNSCTPSTPSRGTLRHSLAFSTSFKHPLMKTANIHSQSQATDAFSISRQASPRSDRGYSVGSRSATSSLEVGSHMHYSEALPGPSHSGGTEMTPSLSLSMSAVCADRSSSASTSRNKKGQNGNKGPIGSEVKSNVMSKNRDKFDEHVSTKSIRNESERKNEIEENDNFKGGMESKYGRASDKTKGKGTEQRRKSIDKTSLNVGERDDDKSSSKSNSKGSEGKSSKISVSSLVKGRGCLFGFFRRQKNNDSDSSDNSIIKTKDKNKNKRNIQEEFGALCKDEITSSDYESNKNNKQIKHKKNTVTKDIEIVDEKKHKSPKGNDKNTTEENISSRKEPEEDIYYKILIHQKIPDDECCKVSVKEIQEQKDDNTKNAEITSDNDGRASSASSERRRLHKAQDSIIIKRRQSKRQEIFV